MGHPQSECLVNVISRRNTLQREDCISACIGTTSAARVTFSKHMIASFIKGIRSAFETKPGTSCDVVTSKEPTLNHRTHKTNPPDLFRMPPQTLATDPACLWRFAPPI